MVTCHYYTLGVPKDATLEEIKAKFRKLSMETHPDIKGGCPEQFKRISVAASVLTNERQRQAYDRSRTGPLSFHRTAPEAPGAAHQRSQYKSNATGMTAILETMFRPRNLILGPIALFATVSAIQYALGIDNKKQLTGTIDTPLVQAWLNPRTGEYETPAPWDPVYRRLQPELEYVEREKVRTRRQ